MDKLLALLDQLYAEQGNTYQDEETGRWYFKDSELCQEVVRHCDYNLISDRGEVLYGKFVALEERGYRVFPGEQDSFGWLTGCIQKKGDKRVVVFG